MVNIDIDDMLQGLDDERALTAMRGGPSPIKDLLTAYKELADVAPELPQYEEAWNGRDLKDALKQLPAEQQLELMLTYEKSARKSDNVCQPFQYQEPPAVTEERRLRHWLIKLGAGTAAGLFIFIIGVMIPVAIMTGKLEAGPVINQILTLAFDISKLLFASPGSPLPN